MKLLRLLCFVSLALAAISAATAAIQFETLFFPLVGEASSALLIMAIVALLLVAVLAPGASAVRRSDDGSFPSWFIANPSTAPPS